MRVWKDILTDFVFLSLGEFGSKLIGFAATIYLARVILPEGFGILGYATAFLSYLILFVDFGLDTICVKSIVNNSFSLETTVNNILSFRLASAFIIFAASLLLIFSVNEKELIKYALVIISLNVFVQAVSLDYAFQAAEKYNYISIKMIVKNLIYLLLVFLFVRTPSDVLLVIVFSSVANLVMNLWLVKKYISIFGKIKFQFDLKLIAELTKEAFPLLFSAFMISIYYNMDMLMLGRMKTQTDVGIYSAAFKIFLIGVLPLNIIFKIFLPSLSKTADKAVLKESVTKYAKMLFLFGASLSVLLILFSQPVILFIYGIDFIDATLPLCILSINLFIISLNIFMGNPLTVWGKQKLYSIAITGGAIVNVVLNIMLIPKYSFTGAAVATILSEAAVLTGVSVLFIKTYKELTGSEIL